MPERTPTHSSSSPSRRWISWNSREGRQALRRFTAKLDSTSGRLSEASARIDQDPFYRHGFGTGWVLTEDEGRGEPLALLWAGFDEWEVQRRRRPIGLFGLRLRPEAALAAERVPDAKEMRAGLEQVARFLRSRAVTDAVGPVQLGFHRDSGWGVRTENSAEAGLLKSLRQSRLTSDTIGRQASVSLPQVQSSPPFLAAVELARDGGKVALRPLIRRPLWRGVRLSLDPLTRVDAREWVRLSALAMDSNWDTGFAEAVPPSPREWIELASCVGARSFLKWSRWIEVAGEPAGFILAWQQGEAVRVRRILLDERYRDFHLAPFALHRLAELAREERMNLLELGPVPRNLAWNELLQGFVGDGSAIIADEAVELFVLEV